MRIAWPTRAQRPSYAVTMEVARRAAPPALTSIEGGEHAFALGRHVGQEMSESTDCGCRDLVSNHRSLCKARVYRRHVLLQGNELGKHGLVWLAQGPAALGGSGQVCARCF